MAQKHLKVCEFTFENILFKYSSKYVYVPRGKLALIDVYNELNGINNKTYQSPDKISNIIFFFMKCKFVLSISLLRILNKPLCNRNLSCRHLENIFISLVFKTADINHVINQNPISSIISIIPKELKALPHWSKKIFYYFQH